MNWMWTGNHTSLQKKKVTHGRTPSNFEVVYRQFEDIWSIGWVAKFRSLCNLDLGHLDFMANADVTETIEIQVLSLTGEGITLKVEKSMLGREVRQMVSMELPGRAGAKVVLHHLREKLMLGQTLEQQGIEKTATLSCTYVPTNLFLAWCFVRGFPTKEGQFALEGVTSLGVQTVGEFLFYLPKSLRSLILQQPARCKWDLSNHLAKQPAELKVWIWIQPELGGSDLAKQPAEPDSWQTIQPELGESDLAK